MQPLLHFGLDVCVGSTSDCCAQNPSQDILSSRICLLAVHTCAWPWLKGSAWCTMCFLGTGQAGAVCFIAVGPEQDSAAAFSEAR